MNLRNVILGGVALLGGCNTSYPPTPVVTPTPTPVAVTSQYTPQTLSASDIATIEQGVRKNLKDPNSAMFGQMKGAKDETGMVQICGYVNAKNSFGGYTGDAIFFGALADTKSGSKAFIPIGSISTSATDVQVKRIMCAKAGIAI